MSVTSIGYRWSRQYAALAALFVLVGCASTPPPSEPDVIDDPLAAFEQRQGILGVLDKWSANGRLALSTTDQSLNASVRWEQNVERYVIHLSGPFGVGATELHGAPGFVAVETEDKVHTAKTPEDLVENILGWRVPLSGLRHWLIGLVAPGIEIEDMRIDEFGRIEFLKQAGWAIRYKRYSETPLLDMPTKVFMDSKLLKARVVVQEWGF
jgi:outer membrane lipoprotein LolB